VRELAIFDLDGTLVEILINKQEYEESRLCWAKCINDKYGIDTPLKPILVELKRLAAIPGGKEAACDVLTWLDQLEVNAQYRCLGDVEYVIREFRKNFRKLVLVSHNGLPFWHRLVQDKSWAAAFDVVRVRDLMDYLKPDVRVCADVLDETVAQTPNSECWVIGDSSLDWELGANIRKSYPTMTVRRFMITTGLKQTLVGTKDTSQLDCEVGSTEWLLGFLESRR
jgi:FMN phosphatase YigB (HAD superfamily)